MNMEDLNSLDSSDRLFTNVKDHLDHTFINDNDIVNRADNMFVERYSSENNYIVNSNINSNNNREKNKKSGKCYTCKPRGKVLNHIIQGVGNDNVVFHFDLHKRPLILLTPKKHYETIYEIPSNELCEMIESIKVFCEFWKIDDYQILFNNGKWQTHPHFHIKIKMNEKIINRLRRDHFKIKKLQNNYEN